MQDMTRQKPHPNPGPDSESGPMSFRFDSLLWIFGVRFLPGATYAIFHSNLEYHVRQAIDMKRLFGDFRHEIMEDYLRKKLGGENGVEEILSYCAKQFIVTNGQVSVEELAGMTGYGVRYIRQLFAKHVGTPQKSWRISSGCRKRCAISGRIHLKTSGRLHLYMDFPISPT